MLWGVKWYFWVLLAALSVLAVFVSIKAAKVSRERRERLRKEAAIWQRDFDLRQNYSELTIEKINAAPKDELLHGAAMNIQIKLEAAADMNAAFAQLPKEKQLVYTLEYFDEDAKKELSVFFKNNGAPLTPLAAPALRAIGKDALEELTEAMFPMYDEDSEVSIDYGKADELDGKFKEIFDSAALCSAAADYIIAHAEIFAE